MGDDNVLHRITSEGLAFAKKAKASMKQGQVVKRNAGKENGLDHKKNMSGELNKKMYISSSSSSKPCPNYVAVSYMNCVSLFQFHFFF